MSRLHSGRLSCDGCSRVIEDGAETVHTVIAAWPSSERGATVGEVNRQMRYGTRTEYDLHLDCTLTDATVVFAVQMALGYARASSKSERVAVGSANPEGAT